MQREQTEIINSPVARSSYLLDNPTTRWIYAQGLAGAGGSEPARGFKPDVRGGGLGGGVAARRVPAGGAV